jgi:hypothetical protein
MKRVAAVVAVLVAGLAIAAVASAQIKTTDRRPPHRPQ